MLKRLFRLLVLGALMLMLVGFGLCGLFGTVMGVDELGRPHRGGGEDFDGVFLPAGLLGLGIAGVSGLCFYFLRRRWRAANGPTGRGR